MEIAARLDPLIADRAPWLWSGRPGTGAARRVLDRVLQREATLALGAALEDLPAAAALDRVAARIARRVRVSGLARVPAAGPVLIVANHPTGIADGVVLWHLLRGRRPDLVFFANADILRVLPGLAPAIVPVEWRPERRSHATARATLAAARAALAEAGRAGVIFPSGRLAQRRGLRLVERPWLASAAQLARRFEVPVVPVHIAARNSALFYAFDLLHPSLRDITLFHETLNKDRQRFDVRIGAPIAPGALPAAPEAAIAALRARVLALGRGGAAAAGQGPHETVRAAPGWPRRGHNSAQIRWSD